MPADLTTQQMAFFAILLVGFALLLTEWLRPDLVAVLIVLALNLTGVLSAEDALSGFASEPAIVVATIFVLTGALHQTGLSEILGRWIGWLAGRSYTRVIAVVMPAVAVLSAFTHHVTTTAVMLPVLLNLSRERGIPPSRLLMPMSFAASLGTTITIIGAPAFLIASGVLRRAGRPGLDVFSIAPVGLTLSVAGTLFMLLVGRLLLPSRGGGQEAGKQFQLDKYFTELTIPDDSPLLGMSLAEVEAHDRYQLEVVGWVRGSRTLDLSARDLVVMAGDVLLVRTSPDQLVSVQTDPGLELRPAVEYGDREATDGAPPGLMQAVIAPGSQLIDRTLGELDFGRRYGAVVLSIWRREGRLHRELSKIPLREGDVLVIQGDEHAIARVAADRGFLMMLPFHGELRPRRKAWTAGAVMLGTVAVAATNALPLHMTFLAGAVAMVLLGCITVPQAYQAIDTRIFVFIAGALPLGTAMEKTGSSALLASWLQRVVGGWDEVLVLAALFTIVAVLTQFMSDAATTAVFAPVAVALARVMGEPPEAYVVTTAMAAVASFLTPIGHHGNLLVYGPGRYRFSDFVLVGTPLTVIVGVVVVWMAPLLW